MAQCIAKTKDGTPCQISVREGQGYCHIHRRQRIWRIVLSASVIGAVSLGFLGFVANVAGILDFLGITPSLLKPRPSVTYISTSPPTLTSAGDQSNAIAKFFTYTSLERNDNPDYRIEVSIPRFANSTDSRTRALNLVIDQILNSRINDFKRGIDSSAAGENYLEISYVIIASADRYLSTVFNFEQHFAGTAMLSQTSQVVNIDLEQFRLLKLDDLFKKDSLYLDAISKYCVNDLQERELLLWSDRAAPRPENFEFWTMSPQGLTITFPKGSVAPGSVEPPSVLVPINVIEPYLDPEGPLTDTLE
jgi:hypothetical protein